MSGLSKQTTGLSMAPTVVPGLREGTALEALKAEMVAKGRHSMLTDVIDWLTDQAEADDVDGAEWDAEFCRKLAQGLAKRFA
jgi:hypothetical protein